MMLHRITIQTQGIWRFSVVYRYLFTR